MAALLILGIGVAACGLPAPSESASSPSAAAASASDTSPEATGLQDGNGEGFSAVLLARAYSAGFSTPDERTAALPLDIIVFQDGLVVARVDTPPEPPTYREMQLSADELASVRLAVEEAGVTDFVVPYDPTFHSSDGMTVLQAIKSDGSLVDIAVVALNANVQPSPPDVPSDIVELDSLLSVLQHRVRSEGADSSRDLPTLAGVLPDE